MFSCISTEYSIDYCFLSMQRWILWLLWPMSASVPIWEQTFLRMQQTEWSSETSVWALHLLHCQDLPSCFRDYAFDGEDATGDIYLPVKTGGFVEVLALKTFDFAQNEFKDQFHAGEYPVSHQPLELPDNCTSISKKVGPAVISSDLSPTGS